MYLEHFQLSAEPFSLTPDPAFLYKSDVHTEALAALKLGLLERRGLIAMVGEVGTGKTTLLYSLLSSLGPRIRTAYVANTKLSFDGLLRSALRDFGCSTEGATRLELLDALNEFLLDCDRQGHTAALIVDEAQNLSDEAFEELRLLSNYETYKRKLLQIVLVGQPELDEKLRNRNLRQVAERIAVRAHVNPLSKEQARAYIEHRLAAVGGSAEIFKPSAIRYIVRRSQGIPRRINVLCHNAMLYAYGRELHRIDKALVVTAQREREGVGLVRLRSFQWPGSRGRRASAATATSAGSAGLTWALTGLVVGIFGALFYMSLFDAREAVPAAVSTAPTAAVSTERRPAQALRQRAATPTLAQAESARANTPAREQAGVSAQASDTELSEAAQTESVSAIPASEPSEAEQAAEAAQTPKTVQAAYAGRAGAVSPPAAAQDVQAPAPQVRDANAAANANVAAEPVRIAHAQAVQGRTSVTAATPGIETQEDEPVVTVKPGVTLIEMVVSIYGDYSAELLDKVRAANPQIRDPNLILAGDRFRFPRTPETTVSNGGTANE